MGNKVITGGFGNLSHIRQEVLMHAKACVLCKREQRVSQLYAHSSLNPKSCISRKWKLGQTCKLSEL